ncbi:MAG TPA: cache domain-containing protein, partial [Anaerolineae bacterium]|nr:cache domain-containing protein [Anaerolineae bacterium]
MKLALKNRIFIDFLTVVILMSSFTTFVGIKFIGKSIPIIQHEVSLDLNSAREMYQTYVEEVKNIIHFSSFRFFIRDTLLAGDIDRLTSMLEEIRQNESLDILSLTNIEGKVILRARNPKARGDSQSSSEIFKKVLAEKKVVASTELFSKEELLKEGDELAARADIRIIKTPRTKSTEKSEETSGLLLIAAAPILNNKDEIIGILYGGNLLNQNYSIVDKVRDTIYEREIYKGKDVGAVSIFQENLRISTNVRTENGDRAVGTLVSAEVENYVFEKGKTWIERAFAVNDWYITAYEPIKNISGKNVGILGIGVLERKYKDLEKHALWIFFGIAFGGIVFSVIICYLLTNSIMRPINSLLLATRNLAKGNMEQQVQLKDAPKEIEALGNAFNFMVLSIKERDEQLHQRAQDEIMKSERLAMVGRLAAGVAHEINNPLGGILLFSRLLIQKAPSEGLMRDNLERIEKEAKRCQNVVQGLLDFAREREPKIEPLELNDVLEKSINLFENQPLFHNIEIVKHHQSDLPLIFADPSQIQQVFVNIIMNASDAMNAHGVLTISTRYTKSNDYVETIFADTGCGIPSDQINRIFEPFFTTKGVGYGTGLGLSISHGIIQRHGGTIKIFSRVNEGSTF